MEYYSATKEDEIRKSAGKGMDSAFGLQLVRLMLRFMHRLDWRTVKYQSWCFCENTLCGICVHMCACPLHPCMWTHSYICICRFDLAHVCAQVGVCTRMHMEIVWFNQVKSLKSWVEATLEEEFCLWLAVLSIWGFQAICLWILDLPSWLFVMVDVFFLLLFLLLFFFVCLFWGFVFLLTFQSVSSAPRGRQERPWVVEAAFHVLMDKKGHGKSFILTFCLSSRQHRRHITV